MYSYNSHLQNLQRVLSQMKRAYPKQYQKLKDLQAVVDKKAPRVIIKQPLSAENFRLRDKWIDRSIDAQIEMRNVLRKQTFLGNKNVGGLMVDFAELARKGMLPTVIAAPAVADQVRQQSSRKTKKKT
jgi:hypothetical protein